MVLRVYLITKNHSHGEPSTILHSMSAVCLRLLPPLASVLVGVSLRLLPPLTSVLVVVPLRLLPPLASVLVVVPLRLLPPLATLVVESVSSIALSSSTSLRFLYDGY